MPKEVPLTQGRHALVDDEDFDWLNQWEWNVSSIGYAVRNGQRVSGRQPKVYIHKLILDAPVGFEGDHINHDKLDNRRSNLRVCTRQQNTWNRRPTHKLKGTHFNPAAKQKPWQAWIRYGGKLIHLGMHQTERDAGLAYNKAAILYFGDFACLNNLNEKE